MSTRDGGDGGHDGGTPAAVAGPGMSGAPAGEGLVLAEPAVMAGATADSVFGSSVAPASGRRVRLTLTLGRETLEIVGPSGATELSIVLTERGPKLVLDTADIQINTVNRISVACESFDVAARGDVSITGAEASLTAREGDATIAANDYVKVQGEQILLNCEDPDRVPAWMQSELGAQFVRAARDRLAAPSGGTPSTPAPASPAPAGGDGGETS